MDRSALLALLLAAATAWSCSPPGAPAARPTPARALPSPGPAARYHPEPAARDGGTATVGDWTFPRALTPPYPQPPSATLIEQALFSGLVGFDPSLEPFGDLAAEVPTVANGGVRSTGSGMDVTYRMRPGLRWSDGHALGPDDIAFTWRVQAALEGYDQVTGIDRAGEGDVVVHFKSVYPPYLLLFGAVLPAHRLKGLDLRQLPADPYWQKPDVVSGPFVIADAVPGDHYTLSRNSHYTDGRQLQAVLGRAAHLERLVFKAFPTRSALLAAVKAGDVDVALELTERDVPLATGMRGVRLRLVPQLSYEQLALNRDDPLFAGEPAVADALMLGVDRHAVLTDVLRGVAPAADSPVSPALGWVPAAPAFPLDPAAAAARLEAAGWTAPAGGVRTKGGRKLQVRLSTTADNPQREMEAEAIAAGWRRLGVEVLVQNASPERLFASYEGGGLLARGGYQAALWAWVTPPDPDSEFGTLTSVRVPGPGPASAFQNYARCRDGQLDAALADGRATLERAARAAAYQRFTAAYQAARCEVPLYQRLNVAVASTRLHNFAPHPGSEGNTWNAGDWWVD